MTVSSLLLCRRQLVAPPLMPIHQRCLETVLLGSRCSSPLLYRHPHCTTPSTTADRDALNVHLERSTKVRVAVEDEGSESKQSERFEDFLVTIEGYVVRITSCIVHG